MLTSTNRAVLAVAALLVIAPLDAEAQESRTVVIVDGKVTINGERVADEAVPEHIRDFDGSVSFTFTGDDDPVIGFGDQLYRIEGDRIVEEESGRHGPRAFWFGAHAPRFEMPEFDFSGLDSSLARLNDDFAGFGYVFTSDGSAQHLGARAQEHAARMQALAREIQHSIPPPGGRVRVFHGGNWGAGPDVVDVVDNQRILRHLEVERELDEEAQRIARELDQISSEDLRAEMEADLREHLDEAFELQQQNRRTEIEELKARLEVLQERLERREELRDRIVQERMEFLLREKREPDNAN